MSQATVPQTTTAAPRLLHVEASLRGGRSASRQVAHTFLDAWADRYSGGAIDVLNVWTTELPAFDGEALDAKYAGLEGREHSTGQART